MEKKTSMQITSINIILANSPEIRTTQEPEAHLSKARHQQEAALPHAVLRKQSSAGRADAKALTILLIFIF